MAAPLATDGLGTGECTLWWSGARRHQDNLAPVAVRVPSSPYQEVFLFACGENGCRVTGRDWALERCSLVGCWVSRRVASRADRPHAFTRTQWKGSFSTFPMQDAHLPFIPQQYTKYSMCTWPNRCNSWWEAATPRLESGRFAMHLAPFPFFPRVLADRDFEGNDLQSSELPAVDCMLCAAGTTRPSAVVRRTSSTASHGSTRERVRVVAQILTASALLRQSKINDLMASDIAIILQRPLVPLKALVHSHSMQCPIRVRRVPVRS